MSHQPFEDWVESGESLTLEQRQALEAHVRECAACAVLARAMAEVDLALQAAEVVGPQPGFGARFARRMDDHRMRAMRRQGLFAFGAALAAVTLLVAPVVGRWILAWDSPGRLVVSLLIRAHDLSVGVRVAGGLARAMLSNLPGIIPAAGALGFLAASLGVIALWMVAWYRFAFLRVREGDRR